MPLTPRLPARCPRLAALLGAMQEIAPLNLADTTWDNVGLLLESSKSSSDSPYKILLTVDLTESVALQAGEGSVDAVISYHPPWFRPAKSLCMEEGKEGRCLAYLASRGVSVYSPHTALDNVRPGINDWVLKCLFGTTSKKADTIIPSTAGPEAGTGRILDLDAPISLEDALSLVSKRFNIPTMRYALGRDHDVQSPIQSIAVCVGSGSSVFSALKRPVDLLLTGEMSHHDLLRATNVQGASVILTEHTTMERAYLFGPFVEILKARLQSRSSVVDAQVSLASDDCDPVRFFSLN